MANLTEVFPGGFDVARYYDPDFFLKRFADKPSIVPNMDRFSAETVASSLEKKKRSGIGSWSACCPSHPEKNPSFSISDNPQGGLPLLFCHAGCSQDEVINALRSKGLWPQINDQWTPSPQKAHAPKPIEDLEEKAKFARQLHEESLPITGTVAEKYLHKRNLTGPFPDYIRFHPSISTKDTDTEEWHTLPSLLSVATDDDGNVMACQAVFLNSDGSGEKAEVKPGRRSYGSIKGSFVKIATGDGPTIETEGVEDGLALTMAMPDAIVDASLGVSNFANAKPKSGQVIIAADQDKPDSPAAKSVIRAAEKLEASGIAVRITKPITQKDWNDVLREGGIEAVRTEFDQGLLDGEEEESVPTFEEVEAALSDKKTPLDKTEFEEVVGLASEAQLEGLEYDLVFEKLKRLAPKGVRAPTLRKMLAANTQKRTKIELVTGMIWSLNVPLPMNSFPDLRMSEDGEPSTPKPTMANTAHMLAFYGIGVRYCVITKKPSISIPGHSTEGDGVATVALETCISQAALCGLSTMPIQNHVAALCHDNPINPVTDYLSTLVWDGSRGSAIDALAGYIQVDPQSMIIRNRIFRLFMIGACAAADAATNMSNSEALAKFEYVFTLMGGQGAQKTKFFRAMLPPPLQKYFKDGLFLDPNDKDSVSRCTQYWIVELGELDATFRRADMARLKAFLSEGQDVYRTPYGRTTDTFTRRTIFVGSVNETEFLRDRTGNRRFWPLNALRLQMPTDYQLIEQAWAEAWGAYIGGEIWWPDSAFESVLDRHRKTFEDSLDDDPLIADVVARFGDLTVDRKEEPGAKRMTAINILRATYGRQSFDIKDTRRLTAWLRVNNLNGKGQPDYTSHGGQKHWLMPSPSVHEQ